MVTTIDPFPRSYAWWDGFGATAGRKNPHTGIDYPVRGGLPTPALVAGVVTDVRTTPWNGTCVTWQAADGVHVSYLHLSGVAVNEGDKVELGQTVGYVGNTGYNSLGNHLHVTVSWSPQAYDGIGPLIDPWEYITDNLDEGELSMTERAELKEQQNRIEAKVDRLIGNDFPITLVQEEGTGKVFAVNVVMGTHFYVNHPDAVKLMQDLKQAAPGEIARMHPNNLARYLQNVADLAGK